jgi:hypothetical protein
MGIIIDRYCLQRVVDIMEGKVELSEQEMKNVIDQLKRKIFIDQQKEQGGAGGRPRREKKIVDFDLDNGF